MVEKLSQLCYTVQLSLKVLVANDLVKYERGNKPFTDTLFINSCMNTNGSYHGITLSLVHICLQVCLRYNCLSPGQTTFPSLPRALQLLMHTFFCELFG